MAYVPIVTPPQFHVDGSPASGYWLKAYQEDTTTAIQMATDSGGGTLVNKIQLNSEGYPEVSSVVVVPHVNEDYKLALYSTESAANNDDTGSAIWIPNKLKTSTVLSTYVDSVNSLTDLRDYTGEATTILLEGASTSGDDSGALYYKATGASAGTYTDNGTSIIVPTGGDGSAAWLRIDLLTDLKNSTLTGCTVKDFGVTYQDHGNTSTTETIDLENGNVHEITLDANCTLTFSNPPASGTYGQFRLIVNQDATGSRTITWPASVVWTAGSAPTLSTGANDVDVLDFFTVDGGTTWFGTLVIQDAS